MTKTENKTHINNNGDGQTAFVCEFYVSYLFGQNKKKTFNGNDFDSILMTI